MHLKRIEGTQVIITLAFNENAFSNSVASDSKRVSVLKGLGLVSHEVNEDI